MSWVWNVMLSFSDEEFWQDGEEAREACEALERVNQWMTDGELVSLTAPTFKEGVGCGLQANLYGGGYKHFDIEGFIKAVEAQDWKDRGSVQLWVKAEGEESFTLIELRRRRSRPPKPAAKSTRHSKPKIRARSEGRRGERRGRAS